MKVKEILDKIRSVLCPNLKELKKKKKLLKEELKMNKENCKEKLNEKEEELDNLNQKIDELEKNLEELNSKHEMTKTLEELANIINDTEKRRIIKYKGRNVPGKGKRMEVPLQVFVQPNDPVIQKDIDKFNLKIKDPLNCDDDILKIYKFTRNYPFFRYKYAHDDEVVNMKEFWMFPFEYRHFKKGDCLPKDTILLKSNGTYETIENIKENDIIIGKSGELSKITKKWDSGNKNILGFEMTNGEIIKVSEEHKMFTSKKGSNKILEIKAKDLKEEMNLIYPKTINLDMVEDFSNNNYEDGFFVGLFTADGWFEKDYRCAISGKDGFPKEEQKGWVEEYCKNKGWKTRWNERYISINSKEAVNFLKEILTENKILKSTNHTLDFIKGFLDGMKADASVRQNDLTYRTVKKELAIQLRTLYRILGYQTSIKKVENHGGYGKNPIYRIGVRQLKPMKKIIKKIHNLGEDYCYDIETENSGIYLPEYDVEVHNCDDHANNLASYLIA
ncbi:MAG: hypothetical protein ACOCRX_11935, partial [Candidatus Woesearchaeota archaeon]